MGARKTMAVFVSHVKKQRHVAEALVRELEARGKKAWFSPRDIPPGTIWDEQIAKGIRECDCFLLVFSAESDRSPQVKHELALADKHRRPMLWVRTKSSEPDQLAYYLTDTQWIDWNGNARSIADALIAMMDGRVSPPSIAKPLISRRNMFIGVGAVSAAAAAGGAWLGLRSGTAPGPRGPAQRVAPSIQLNASPSEVISGGGFIYVTGRESGTVERINTTTHERVDPPLNPANTVHGAAFDSRTGYLWVAEFNAHALTVYDGEKGQRIRRLKHVGGGDGPFRLAVDPDGERTYVACAGHDVNTVSVIETSTYKILPPLKVGGNPAGMAVDPRTHKVLVTSRDDDLVSLVDPSTGAKQDIPVGRRPFRCVIDAQTGLGYVANASENFVSVIDLDAAKPNEVHRISVGVHPVGIALDSVAGVAYISNAGVPEDADRRAGSVTMVSLTNYKDTTTFMAGVGTTGIAVDANGVVYAANQIDRNLTVLSPT